MLLSIIVPIYMVEKKLLDKCVRSILNQTFCDFELILVNDGSPNVDSLELELYKNNDDRVKIINKKNGGVSSARNAGIEIAQGKYIGFIDSDDWIESDFYEEMITYAKINDLDIVVSGYIKDFDGRIKNIFEKDNRHIFDRKRGLQNLLDRRIYTWSIWDKIYKKSLFKKHRFDENIRMGEDLEVLWRIFQDVNRIGYIPLNKYHYCFRKNSAVNNNKYDKKIESVNVIHNIVIESKQMDDNLHQRSKELYLKELASSIVNAMNNNRKNIQEINFLKNEAKKYMYVLLYNKDFSWIKKIAIILLVNVPFPILKLMDLSTFRKN